MEIIKLAPRGYCYGVVNALKMVEEAMIDHPHEQIYIMGIIIHNKIVKDALDKKGVISLYDNNKTRLELLEDINEGVIIFSAHGSDQAVVNLAKEKGLIVYDAVCKDVVKTHDSIKEYLSEDYEILYVGKKQHPEAVASMSINPKKIKIIESINDIKDIKISDKTMVTNQTTMSKYDTADIFQAIKVINPNVIILDEICNATIRRQEAVMNCTNVDTLYVVGDNLSNNCNNLVKLAKHNIPKVFLLESANDINPEDLKNAHRIAVTSGASTPNIIFEQVCTYLSNYPKINPQTIDYDFKSIL